jgi:cytoskeleton protein RodZ
MSSIGERLRQERLRRGLELDQIAEETRINARYLEAIEAGDLDQLPGGFFTRSFMRQYARLLELDDPELEAELMTLTGPAEPTLPAGESLSQEFDLAPISPNPRARRLNSRRALASLAGFLAVVLVCSGLYALWQRPWRTPEPARNAAPAPAPTPATAPAPPPAPPSAQNLPAEPPTSAGGLSAAQPQLPVAAPEASPAQPEPGPAPVRLDIRATEEVWIRVSADGKYLYSGTLQPGQTKTFQGQAAMSLLTGNAGGLEIDFNGKPLGPIGPKGQIRTVEFTPQGHQILERKPPPPPDVF